ncbi:unnamed protein product [Ambrosiozyma monospora]|uniref:Unnamed protein product n=1 Tax=Ambrosiozyma monospora TaxID=43982 RepID=A0ACB5TXL3_AMBMO|nr:unnamed protein product [Ambrosiozyma monospora]
MFPPATACSPPPQARSPNSTSNNNLLSLRRPSMESDSGYKSSVNVTPYSETTEIIGPSSFTPLEQPQFVSPYFDHQQQQQLKANVGFAGPSSFEDNTELSFHPHHYPQQAQHQQEFRVLKRPSLPIGSFQSRSYELVRGTSAGGAMSRPPQSSKYSAGYEFLKCELNLIDVDYRSICLPQWSHQEIADRRRIIRVERRQNKNEIIASFSILSAEEANMETQSCTDGADVVEVSCLESFCNKAYADDDENIIVTDNELTESQLDRKYYITSVEVIKIVELLIGNGGSGVNGSGNIDPREKRKERGRIRSNLVPFWSRKPISSKKTSSSSSPIMGDLPRVGKTNADLRNELAQRIMSYETRKPRGFDKEVRILEWSKLAMALRRALQSYYAKIPSSELH